MTKRFLLPDGLLQVLLFPGQFGALVVQIVLLHPNLNLGTDASFASEFLGGQNAYEYFAPVAENIKIAPLSSYDQGCVELIQNAFSDYFQGNVDYDRAKSNFETAIKERYPDVTEIQWAE